MKAEVCNAHRWRRRLTQTGKNVSFEWDSYEDYLADFKQLEEVAPDFVARVRGSGGGGGERWYGTTEGFNGVMRKTQNGWPELREAMMKKLDGLALDLPVFPSMTHTRRRKRRRDDHGDTLDIQRVWAGDLDHAWQRAVRMERLQQNMRRITLAFDVTANAGVSNEQAMWRGALCMLLVDSLARAGRTFEIYTVDSTTNPFGWTSAQGTPTRLWTSWLVKPTHMPIVPDRLAAMVSVGFMRVVGFCAEGMGPWEVSSGFGGAMNAGLPHSLNERQEAGEVVLRIGECYSRTQVINEYKSAWERIERAAVEQAA